jgi:hypothetical protein
MSFKPEILAIGEAKWTGNGMAFATKAEVKAYLRDLKSRWSSVNHYRVVGSRDPINYRWNKDRGRAEVLPEGFFCPLCGQRIDDGKPCGCGAR